VLVGIKVGEVVGANMGCRLLPLPKFKDITDIGIII
jgi:hypothetical protein